MAENQVVDQGTPAVDYSALITPEPVPVMPVTTPPETPEPEPVAETPEPDAEVDEGQEPATEPEAKEEQAEKPAAKTGTSDKALQKVQQNLAGIKDQLAALMEKQALQGSLTPKQQEKVEQLVQDREDIAKMLREDYQWDVENTHKDLAKAIQERDKQHDSDITSVRAELQELKVERYWDAESRKPENEGINVRDIFAKCCKDVDVATVETMLTDIIGQKPTAKQMEKAMIVRATEMYNERRTNAIKSVQAKKDPVPQPKSATTTARSIPPKTPGGTRVVQKGSPVVAGEVSDIPLNMNVKELTRLLIK